MTMSEEPRLRPGDREHSRHDLDLVAAYAGDDPGIDQNLAAGLVAACSDCRSEFDLQRKVKGWMASAPVVSLGDEERSLLHDRVNRAVAKPAVVSISDRRRRRQPGQLIFRIGTAAAALAVVAGLGGVFGNIGGDTDATTAFESLSTELAAGSEAANAAAPTTTAAAMYGATTAERAMLVGGDLEAVKKEVEELIGRVAAREEAQAPEDTQADAMISVPPCSDQVEDREVLLSAESVLDGEPIIVFVVSGEEATQALVFQTADCSVVDLG